MELIWEGITEAVKALLRGDAAVLEIALLSLELSGLATLIALAFGVPLGALLAFKVFPGRGFTVSLINTGMGLPPVVVGLFVCIVLWRSGPLGFLELLYTPGAIVLAQFIIAFPVITGLTTWGPPASSSSRCCCGRPVCRCWPPSSPASAP
jgi:tungstate transport system permease protein